MSPPVPVATARGFLEALRSEYLADVFEAVRLYYETGIPDDQQVSLDPFEARVRGADDKLEAILELTAEWKLDCPPVRASTAKGFLKALRAEYLKGVFEAVRLFYETGIPDAEQVALDPYEARIRAAKEEKKEAILDLFCEWNMDYPPVPLATARGFFQAIRKEYLENTFEAVRLYYETGVPDDQQVALDPYEARVREAADKAQEIADLAAEWNMDCAPVPTDIALGFVQAARDEYLRGVFEAVRLYYETGVPDAHQVALDPFEARVRDAGDKLAAIIDLVEEWNLDSPPVRVKTARGFIKALHAEYIGGTFEAVRIYYETGVPDPEQVALDPYEAEVRNASDKAAVIAELAALWGM